MWSGKEWAPTTGSDTAVTLPMVKLSWWCHRVACHPGDQSITMLEMSKQKSGTHKPLNFNRFYYFSFPECHLFQIYSGLETPKRENIISSQSWPLTSGKEPNLTLLLAQGEASVCFCSITLKHTYFLKASNVLFKCKLSHFYHCMKKQFIYVRYYSQWV